MDQEASAEALALALTVDPTTNAAPIMTKFLKMYWPSIVNPIGNSVNTTFGKSTIGRNVPGI